MLHRLGGLGRSSFFTRHGKSIPAIYGNDVITNENEIAGFRVIHLTWAIGTFEEFTAPMHAVHPSAPAVVMAFKPPVPREFGFFEFDSSYRLHTRYETCTSMASALRLVSPVMGPPGSRPPKRNRHESPRSTSTRSEALTNGSSTGTKRRTSVNSGVYSHDRHYSYCK